MTVVGTLEAELKADPSQWEAAMKKSIEAMDKMTQKFIDSSRRISAANKATEEAASSLAKLQTSAKDLGERFSKVGAVTSGMGAAFSTAVPQMQGAVSAAAGLAQAFASGGPLLAGIALAGTVIGAVASKFQSMKKEAEDAAAALQKVRDEARAATAAALGDFMAQEREIATLEAQILAGPGDRSRVATDMAQQFAREDLKKTRASLARLEAEARTIVADAEQLGNLEAAYAIKAGEKILENNRRLDADQQKRLTEIEIEAQGLRAVIATEDQRIERMRYRNQLQDAYNKMQQSGGPAPAAADVGISATMQAAIELDEMNASLARGSAELNKQLQGANDTAVTSAQAFKGLGDVLRDSAEQARRAAMAERERARSIGSQAAGVIGAVGSGSIGSFAAQAGLGAIGSAVSIALGDVTGQIGGQIGQAIGSILGPMADEMMANLGTLEPLFEGLRAVVGALLPAMGLLGDIARVVGAYFSSLAPALTAVAELFVSLSAVVWQNTIKPFIQLSILMIGLLTPALQLVSGALFQLVVFLDEYVYLPLARAGKFLYDAIKSVVDGIIAALNHVLGFMGLDAIRIGYMPAMAEPTSILDMLRPALEDNTDALRDFSKSVTNLPAGYRYALTEYRSESADGFGGGGVGRRDMARGGGGLVINGNVNVMARDANVLEAIRRTMRERGVPYGGPVGSAPPKRN